MALISIVICLFAERFLGYLQWLRNYTWFRSYAAHVISAAKSASFLYSKFGVLIILLPAPLLVAYIDYYLYRYFIPFEFLFGTAILLFSFGPKTFYGRCKAYCQAQEQHDEECANWFAEHILNRNLSENEKAHLPYTVTHALFIISNERILGPIFWFILLGPMGALLYRLASELHLQSKNQADFDKLQKNAELFFAILNWLPARCAAFGFASMGNFLQALSKCRQEGKSFYRLNNHCSEEVMYCAGAGSLNLPKNADEFKPKDAIEALALIRRNYALWLGAIALLTLGGWLT